VLSNFSYINRTIILQPLVKNTTPAIQRCNNEWAAPGLADALIAEEHELVFLQALVEEGGEYGGWGMEGGGGGGGGDTWPPDAGGGAAFWAEAIEYLKSGGGWREGREGKGRIGVEFCE
jgi:hypothetical protein